MTMKKTIGVVVGGIAFALSVMMVADYVTSPGAPEYIDVPVPVEKSGIAPGNSDASVYEYLPPVQIGAATGGDLYGKPTFTGDRYVSYDLWGVGIVINITKGLLALGMLAFGLGLGVVVGYRTWGRTEPFGGAL